MPPKKKSEEEVVDKVSARNKALASINKKFGSGAISKMSQWDAGEISTIPTGSIGLDLILGRGGWPRGRISELVGYESAGKSTLMLHAAAECQKLGGAVAYIDIEHSLNSEYSQELGVDLDNLVLAQPNSGEEALSIVEELVKSNGFDLIIVDSVAALVPQKEVEAEMGASQMGSQARLLSQGMRKLVPIVGDSNCVLLMVNQYREALGVMYGPKEKSVGGNALRYAASVRVEITKSKSIKDGDNVIGNITRVKTIKNKVAPPFKTAEFNIIYGKGVDRSSETIMYGLNSGLVPKEGNTFFFNGQRIAVGLEKAKEYFIENEEAAAQLEKQVYSALSNVAVPSEPAVVDEPEPETDYDQETGETY